MLTLKGRQDGFRLLLPKEFIPEEINEKYTKILTDAKSFICTPIDFVNETIQKVDVLGFNSASLQQNQSGTGEPIIDMKRTQENAFLHTSTPVYYRNLNNPISLLDRTLNIDFRHTVGYINYFIIFESFFYQYSRDRKYSELAEQFKIDLFNEKGEIYSKIVLEHPIIDGIDMLSFDYTQPIAQSKTFRVIFKYSNFDYQFINIEDDNPD